MKGGIEIVTHAYAGDLPQFAVFLQAQLSSLLRYASSTPVTVTVCYSLADTAIAQVVDRHRNTMIGWLQLNPMPMSEPELFRRCIGRNRAALATEADVVWFADVDHCFGPQCLNELWDIFQELGTDPHEPTLVWPERLCIHRDHETGDRFWQQHLNNQGIIEINPSDFVDKGYHSAIGGVQIVKGTFARQYGYLDGNAKWQQPRTDGKPFGDFRDDVRFRSFCLSKGPGLQVPIPNLYRLRHSKVTYKG